MCLSAVKNKSSGVENRLFQLPYIFIAVIDLPKRGIGKIIFALCCALITVLIRFYGNYPEGASFAILLMNILFPYVDLIGAKKQKTEEVAE